MRRQAKPHISAQRSTADTRDTAWHAGLLGKGPVGSECHPSGHFWGTPAAFAVDTRAPHSLRFGVTLICLDPRTGPSGVSQDPQEGSSGLSPVHPQLSPEERLLLAQGHITLGQSEVSRSSVPAAHTEEWRTTETKLGHPRSYGSQSSHLFGTLV